jgi:hypothetical protein
VEGLTLVFLALLAGVVLYLVLGQRHFQRVDYGHLLMQEERERQTLARLEHAERLLADLRQYDRERRRELDELVARAGAELAHQIDRAREDITAQVLNHPEVYDHLLEARSGLESGVQPAPGEPVRGANSRAARAGAQGNPSLVRFLRSPRQQQIAGMLELGFNHQAVSRELGVSRHEVELVSAIIFSEKTA